MNKYLKKLASWKSPGKFVGYLTGGRKREALSKVRHMEEAIANKKSLADLHGDAAREVKETTKARLAAGIAAGAGVAGAGYGYKRVRDKQKRETAEQYNILFKESSAASEGARAIAREGGSAVTRLLKNVGKTTADMMNSAGGGKIKDYATRHGINSGTPDYKKFVGSSPAQQLKMVSQKRGGGGSVKRDFKKDQIDTIRSLHKERRNAKIGLTASGAAGISAYGWKKSRDAAKKNNPYM
jgi:hypothetical protein